MSLPEIYRPELRQARILRALVASSSLLFGLLGLLLFDGLGEAQECSADEDCPQAQFCLESTCINYSEPAFAPSGQLCKVGFICDPDADDLCAGFVCTNGILHMASRGPEICDDEQTMAFWQGVETKCGDSEKCSLADFKKLVISNEDFDGLIQGFETAFAIHFESGRPSQRDRGRHSKRWPLARDSYIEQLTPLIPVLEDASTVILISTASSSANGSAKNEELALRRLREARYLINEAAKRADINPDTLKLIDTNVGDELQRDEASYQHLALSNSIFADPERGKLFADLIKDFDAATAHQSKKRKKSLRAWRDAIVNQAVLVVSNPCKRPDEAE